MTIPKGALSTFEELEALVASGSGKFYVSPMFIRDDDDEGVHVAEIMPNTKFTKRRIEPLGGIEALNLTDENPPRAYKSKSFIFTNYWLAYAHYVRWKQQGKQ